MIEKIKKMMDDDNEVLNVLPQNSENNRKKYLNQLTRMKDKYLKMQKEVMAFIKARNAMLRNKYNVNYQNEISTSINDLELRLSYFNPYHDAYEILGLDRLFYSLHKYYDNDLNIYNNNINKILNVFQEVGITVTKDDFFFGDCSKKYMEVFISERSRGDYNSSLVKDTFEELFWKNHNMMRHILLNFYHLYYLNEKRFNEYVKNKRIDILSSFGNSYQTLLSKYQELIVYSNSFYLSNKGVFFDKFISKELTTNDYDKEKIEKIISGYIDNSNPASKELFMKLYASIREEKFIFQYKYILDEVDKLYKEKDSFKNLVSGVKKEISTIEKKIHDKYKKINSRGFFRKPNVDLLRNEIDELLIELDGKYDLLDENRYKERIGSMVNPKLIDYFYIGKSYLFMHKIASEGDIDIDNVIDDISRNIYSPYNALTLNINYSNIEELNLIVYDKYRLLGLNLTTEDFQEENLEGIMKVMGNIIIYYSLLELEINILEINFIIDSDDIIKRVSSS